MCPQIPALRFFSQNQTRTSHATVEESFISIKFSTNLWRSAFLSDAFKAKTPICRQGYVFSEF
ncbi:MAG: hypothetical protein ABIF85_03705 [Nanoarchaeota archaeon]|nr:hypothetical protein [Nanoarchaeota archaeon]